MGSSSKKTTVGYKYHLGMHMVFCHGPVDSVSEIRVDDKVTWAGGLSNGSVEIDQPELLGGSDREGGIVGNLDIMGGSSGQTKNSYLASILGEDVPAFRGVLSLVLNKMYLGNSPYLKTWAIKATRIQRSPDGGAQWQPDLSSIMSLDNTAIVFMCDFCVHMALPIGDSPREGFRSTLKTILKSLANNDNKNDIAMCAFGTNSYPLESYSSVDFSSSDYNAAYNFIDSVGNMGGAYEHGDATEAFSFAQQFLSQSSKPNKIILTVTGNYLVNAESSYNAIKSLSSQFGSSFQSRLLASYLSNETVDTEPLLPLTTDSSLTVARARLDSTQGWTISNSMQTVDMNPIHIIREVMTNTVWGSMGLTSNDIDDVNFEQAASTLLAEGMGMSLLWDRQTSSEEFITDVLRHINAMLYVDRFSGKFKIKLVRDDYDITTLPIINEDSVIKMSDYTRSDPSECVNSVTVTYTDQSTGQDATVTVSDTAQIQSLGNVVNTTIQYPGFSNSVIASRVAARDLKTLSTPMLSVKMDVTAEHLGFNIGDVFILEWPDYHEGGIVMRIMELSLGDGSNNIVKITASEDVFALPVSLQVGSEDGGWTNPIPDTQNPPDWTLAEEASYYEVAQTLGDAAALLVTQTSPEIGYVVGVASYMESMDSTSLWVEDEGGYVDSDGRGEGSPYAYVSQAVDLHTTSISFSSAKGLDEVVVGTYFKAGEECLRIDAIDEVNGVLTVGRGVLDTVPKLHPTGTLLSFAAGRWASYDEQYVDGETVKVKVLGYYPWGNSPLNASLEHNVTIEGRAAKPYPPANVTINGQYWPDTVIGDLQIEWAHRNRVQQTAGTLIDYYDDSVTLGQNTTYTLRIFNQDDVLGREVTGITDSSYEYTKEMEDSDFNPGGGAEDPHFSNVVLVMNMDGNAGNEFVDLSNNNAPIVNHGAVTQDLSETVTGSGSARITGVSGQFLEVDTSGIPTSDYYSTNDKFTVELWAYFDASTGTDECILGKNGNPTTYWRIERRTSGVIRFRRNFQINVEGSTVIADKTWVHIAVTRDGANGYVLYINGVKDGEQVSTSRAYLSEGTYVIGAGGDWNSELFNGYVDCVRITRDVVRYTGNFTPSTEPFPLGGGGGTVNTKLKVELETVENGIVCKEVFSQTFDRQ